MEVDWAQAWQIGGIGFGLVFAVLVILAFVVWLTGLLLSKITGGTNTAKEKQESQKK